MANRFPAPPPEFHNKIKNLSSPATFYLYHGLAKSTRTGINAAVRRYTRFCEQHHYKPFPITQKPLTHFITDETHTHGAAHIKRTLGNLKSHQIDLGYGNEIFENDSQIKRIMRGVQIVLGNSNTGRQAERAPITRDILIRLVQRCDDSYNGIAIRAAMCIAFAGFLRTGEFTYEKWDTGSHIMMVSRRSIQFGKDSVTLTLPKSKTDVFGKGTPIPMPATGDAICP